MTLKTSALFAAALVLAAGAGHAQESTGKRFAAYPPADLSLRNKQLTPFAIPGDQSDLGSLIYQAAQTLAERAGLLAKDKPILVATMVNINDLSQSSTFGRLASQLVSNRLSQRGYMVRDVTFARALMVKPETGELVLSHEAARASASVNAQAVVAGTYAVGGRQIFLNLRLLKADDGEVISSADLVVPLDHDTEPMVASLGQPGG